MKNERIPREVMASHQRGSPHVSLKATCESWVAKPSPELSQPQESSPSSLPLGPLILKCEHGCPLRRGQAGRQLLGIAEGTLES